MLSRTLTVLALAASLVFAGCGINSVPRAEEAAKAKWADVENQYQRRADLVPNLVETVKAFAEQEREVLTEVTEARAKATAVNIDANDLTDPAKMQAFAEAQGQLGGALGRLLASFEAYPELRSSENFLALQSQLEGTENRIAVARRDFNEAVRVYNTTIRTFPDLIGARFIHGAEAMALFEATTQNAEQAPKVDFSSGG